MKQFRIKQKFWSLGGRFEIFDQLGSLGYQVEGSVLRWLKEYEVKDALGQPVSHIKEEWSWFLPRFTVTMKDGRRFTIQKEFTWFKDRYTIADLGLEVQGDFWDMNFSLLSDNREVARISQEWFALMSTYNVEVYEDVYADVAISLVIAIDFVKERAAVASSAASS